MYNHGALPCAFMLGSVWLASLVTSKPSRPATCMRDPALPSQMVSCTSMRFEVLGLYAVGH